MSKTIVHFCAQLICFFLCLQTFGSQTPRLVWTKQLQTEIDAFGNGVALSRSGDVYVTGYTDTARSGSFQGWNTFLSKYDTTGSLQWTKSLNHAYLEESNAVTVDGSGDVYITGSAGGSLDGLNYSGRDVFLSKLNSAGDLLWSRQIGASGVDDVAKAITRDGIGNIYISGYTDGGLGEVGLGERDAFLAKYDPEGTLLWKQLMGTETRDESHAVFADHIGHVYVTSQTLVPTSNLGILRRDAYLSKFNGDGSLVWRQQQHDIGPFSSDSATPQSISGDSLGNIFLSGYTSRGGSSGASFIRKLDSEGNIAWTRLLGSTSNASSVVDGFGNVFLSGTLSGATAPFFSSAMVMKLDGDGQILWQTQTDAVGADFGHAVATDGLGTIYLAGRSYDGSYVIDRGQAHAFVTKFLEVPEPNTILLLLIWGSMCLFSRR